MASSPERCLVSLPRRKHKILFPRTLDRGLKRPPEMGGIGHARLLFSLPCVTVPRAWEAGSRVASPWAPPIRQANANHCRRSGRARLQVMPSSVVMPLGTCLVVLGCAWLPESNENLGSWSSVHIRDEHLVLPLGHPTRPANRHIGTMYCPCLRRIVVGLINSCLVELGVSKVGGLAPAPNDKATRAA